MYPRVVLLLWLYFFFFKQKTAYEMRISDWSSVVCSSDLGSADYLTPETGFPVDYRLVPVRPGQYPGGEGQHWADPSIEHAAGEMRRVYENPVLAAANAAAGRRRAGEIGRAAGRERVGQDV